MSRPILSEDRIHPAVLARVHDRFAETVREVIGAVDRHPIVVVGMAQNPHCRKARKHLEAAGKNFEYLEYGSYLKGWRQRTAIKMWSGWQSFPMVFVGGVMVGGASDLQALIDEGGLEKLVAAAG